MKAPLLGRVGVWSRHFVVAGWPEAAALAERVEALGFGAAWFPETPVGREAVAAAASLLGHTQRLAVGSGIASIWARDPVAAEGAAVALSEVYESRFLLGLGVSHAPAVAARGHDYTRPYSAMVRYLDELDAAASAAARPPSPRVLAALAPRMLELAAERTAGALTYFVPPEHTAKARERLGPDALLAVELAVVLEADASRARARAREHARSYLALENYRRNLARLGYGNDDLDRGGSDAVIDRVVAWGDVDDVAARVREHFDAGADHVAIQPLVAVDEAAGVLERLAPTLTSA